MPKTRSMKFEFDIGKGSRFKALREREKIEKIVYIVSTLFPVIAA